MKSEMAKPDGTRREGKQSDPTLQTARPTEDNTLPRATPSKSVRPDVSQKDNNTKSWRPDRKIVPTELGKAAGGVTVKSGGVKSAQSAKSRASLETPSVTDSLDMPSFYKVPNLVVDDKQRAGVASLAGAGTLHGIPNIGDDPQSKKGGWKPPWSRKKDIIVPKLPSFESMQAEEKRRRCRRICAIVCIVTICVIIAIGIAVAVALWQLGVFGGKSDLKTTLPS